MACKRRRRQMASRRPPTHYRCAARKDQKRTQQYWALSNKPSARRALLLHMRTPCFTRVCSAGHMVAGLLEALPKKRTFLFPSLTGFSDSHTKLVGYLTTWFYTWVPQT